MEDGDDDDGTLLVPLGAPIPGTRLWVQVEGGSGGSGGEEMVEVWSDARGKGVVEGELWVEGPGVALGYYKQGEATAASFVFPSFVFPSNAPPRFRTGDWVRLEGAGTGALTFVGRRDGLVKVRGVRVGLKAAERRVAAALGLGVSGRGGRPQLALAALDGGGGLLLALTAGAAAAAGVGDGAAASVWRRLRGRVPPEMIPSRVCVGPVGAASVPLTGSGKVDRRACVRGWGREVVVGVGEAQEQEDGGGSGDQVAEWVEACFAALLGAGGEGAGVGFFDRGGTSLLAMQALGRIDAEFGVQLGVEELGRDVRGLADRIVKGQQEQDMEGREKRNGAEAEAEAAAAEDAPPRAPLALSVAWRVDLGRCVDASPLLARVPAAGAGTSTGEEDGEGPPVWVAIAGSHSRVVAAVDARTGRERWRTPVGGRVEGGAALSGDGRLCLVGCYDGRLYALKVATGAVAFVVPTGGEIKGTPLSLSSLSLDGGGVGVGPAVCVLGSYDGHAYVVSERDGAVLARVALGGSPFASPVVVPYLEDKEGEGKEGAAGARVVMVTNRGRVVQLRLSVALDPPASESAAVSVSATVEWARDVGCAVFTTPAVVSPHPGRGKGRLLVLGGTDGTLLALDPCEGGREAWRVDLRGGPVFCPPLPVGGAAADVIVGGQDGSLRRVDGSTGAVVWVAEAGGWESVTGRPVLLGEGEGAVVAAATAAGWLRLLDVGTGEGVGAVRVGAGQRLGSPVVLRGGKKRGGEVIVVGSRDDGVYGASVGVQYDGGGGGAKRPRLAQE